MDILSTRKRSEIMSLIGSKDTKPEREVFKYLRSRKIYFQKHYKKAPGKPDVALPRKKIAVFIDGDFWHGYCFKAWEKKLTPFWREKISGNMRRDKKNFARLRRDGWKVLRIWQHDLKKGKKEKTFERIESFLKS